MASSDSMSGEYAAHKAAVEAAYQKAMAELQARRGKLLSDYGYDESGKLDPANKFGRYQQAQHMYERSKENLATDRSNFQRNYGVKILGKGQYQEEGNDGLLQRLKQDKDRSLNVIGEARNRVQFLSGLRAKFDPGNKPLALMLSNENENGAFQRMLGGQARSLEAYEDTVSGRGLGRKGLGAQLVGRAEGDHSAQRQDFREGLIDTLTGQARDEENVNLGYTRSRSDAENTIMDSISGFFKGEEDIEWGWGAEQKNLANALAEALFGVDHMMYSAGSDYRNALGNGLIQELLNRLNNPTSTDSGGTQTSSSDAAGSQLPSWFQEWGSRYQPKYWGY